MTRSSITSGLLRSPARLPFVSHTRSQLLRRCCSRTLLEFNRSSFQQKGVLSLPELRGLSEPVLTADGFCMAHTTLFRFGPAVFILHRQLPSLYQARADPQSSPPAGKETETLTLKAK